MPHKKEYFQRVANIALYILSESGYTSYTSSYGLNRLKEEIEGGPNPCPIAYGVIPDDNSLLLEMSYEVPKCFHTPLGAFHIASDCYVDDTVIKRVRDLKIKLGLVEVFPEEQREEGGPFGPIFAVTRDLDGNPFSMPVVSSGGTIAIDYATAKKEWDVVKPSLELAKTEVARSSPGVLRFFNHEPIKRPDDTRTTPSNQPGCSA